MASGYRNAAGVDADDLYDPDVVGDGPSAVGYRKVDGTTLRYAAAGYGTPGAAMGYRMSNGVDIGTLWSRKGTAVYTLPINGKTYTRGGGRGTHSLTWTMRADGTYAITDDVGTVYDSGTWLPAGDSVSAWSCQFTQTGGHNGPDPDGGSDTVSDDMPSPATLTSDIAFSVVASATVLNTNASNGAVVTAKLFRSGVLRSTTSVTFNVSAAG